MPQKHGFMVLKFSLLVGRPWVFLRHKTGQAVSAEGSQLGIWVVGDPSTCFERGTVVTGYWVNTTFVDTRPGND